MGFFFLLGLIVLFAIWIGLGVGRHPSRAVLWTASVLTALLVSSFMFVSTKIVKSEAEAFVYGEALIYLLSALAFTFPFTLISWWMKLRNRSEWDKSKT